MKLSQMLKACLNYKVIIGVGLIIMFAYFFAPQLANYSWILIALICPLSMMFMMAGMHDKPDNKSAKLYVCPECDLSYKDQEWAKKCAAWCREHKSCNLEIIKHAEK